MLGQAILLAADYAELDRVEDAIKELNLAITLRANEASILYNAACTYALLKRKGEALHGYAAQSVGSGIQGLHVGSPGSRSGDPAWRCGI